MAVKHVVDTHALIWFLEGNPRLGANARTVLEDPNSALVLPAITLAEACWIVEHGKTSIPSVADLLNAVDSDSRVEFYPLDRAILDKSNEIPEIDEMHDRQIVATAILLTEQGDTVHVLTKDGVIVGMQSLNVTW